MIQAIGLTSISRRNAEPAVADVTFDVRRGEVTGLLGPAGSGKTTVLRLLLGMDPGRGATLVDGCPLRELPHPERTVGAVVGDVPGHPGRSARGHLRMLCSAFGLPVSRGEEVLHLVGLDAVADEPLRTHSLGMDRRLGFAVALLTRPRFLVLDDPVRGLPPREAAWVHDLVRRHAAGGGAVLLSGRDTRALARTADHLVVLHEGRLAADEPASHFARTRLRPYVSVRSPYAQRLAELLAGTGAEVVPAGGSRIAVYGTSSASVGETAYRHGILLHQLADLTGDGTEPPVPPARTGATSGAARDPGAPAPDPGNPVSGLDAPPAAPEPGVAAGVPAGVAASTSPQAPAPGALVRAAGGGAGPAPGATVAPGAGGQAGTGAGSAPKPSRWPDLAPRAGGLGDGADSQGQSPRAAGEGDEPAAEEPAGAEPVGRVRTGPVRPLGYETRRAFAVGTPWLAALAALAGSAVATVAMTRHGAAPGSTFGLISGWLPELPLPPAAIGAGALGALTYGQEYRYPALAPGHGPEPHHPRLLAAKLATSALAALVLAALAAVADVALLRSGLAPVAVAPDPGAHPGVLAAWAGLAVGCAWTGVLAAAVFRTTALGVATVLGVPLLAVPAVRALPTGRVGREMTDAGAALWSVVSGAPQGGVRRTPELLRMVGQPLVLALVLCLAVLLGAYAASALRGGRRQRPPTAADSGRSAR